MANAWQQYADSLEKYYPDGCEGCGVFGTNGSTWAHNRLNHAADPANYLELTTLSALFADANTGFSEGFSFNGRRFVLVKMDEDLGTMQAKSKDDDKLPLCVQQCNTCMVIMLGNKGSNGGTVSKSVGQIGDHLKNSGY